MPPSASPIFPRDTPEAPSATRTACTTWRSGRHLDPQGRSRGLRHRHPPGDRGRRRDPHPGHPDAAELVAGQVLSFNNIYFDSGSANIKAESFPILDVIAETLLANEGVNVRIVVTPTATAAPATIRASASAGPSPSTSIW